MTIDTVSNHDQNHGTEEFSSRLLQNFAIQAVRCDTVPKFRLGSPNPGPPIRIPGDVLARRNRRLANICPASHASASRMWPWGVESKPEFFPPPSVRGAHRIGTVVVWRRRPCLAVDNTIVRDLLDVADVFFAVRVALGHRFASEDKGENEHPCLIS